MRHTLLSSRRRNPNCTREPRSPIRPRILASLVALLSFASLAWPAATVQAAHWVPCLDAGGYGVECVVSYNSNPGLTYGVGTHINRDDVPSNITVTLTLEQKQPDGTYTGIWTESKNCYDTTICELQSQQIDCDGDAKWHLVTQRSDQDHFFYTDTYAFYVG